MLAKRNKKRNSQKMMPAGRVGTLRTAATSTCHHPRLVSRFPGRLQPNGAVVFKYWRRADKGGAGTTDNGISMLATSTTYYTTTTTPIIPTTLRSTCHKTWKKEARRRTPLTDHRHAKRLFRCNGFSTYFNCTKARAGM